MERKTIKVSKENQKILEDYTYEIDVARITFAEASRLLERANSEFGEALMRLFPETAEGSSPSYDPKDGTLEYTSAEDGVTMQ